MVRERHERRLGAEVRHRLAGNEPAAAEYFRLAGEYARALYANAQALAHFRLALALGLSLLMASQLYLIDARDPFGYAIGAAVVSGHPVIAVEGDSAFGFSGMEIETVCRYHLPIVTVVFNNGEWAKATVIATDPQADLAVIKVTPPKDFTWKPLPLAQPDSPRPP